jgi:hypothetical protein
MHRRRYLASVAVLISSTGCLGTSTRTSKSQGDDGISTTTTPVTPPRTSENQRDDGDNTTATPVCPPFETDADRTICFRTRSDSESIWLGVSHADWTIDTTDDTIETNSFKLHNESDTTLRFNPHSWELYEQQHKQTSTKWKEFSRQDGSDHVSLAPNETYHWSLSRQPHPSPNTEHTDYITADIDTGRYAFVVRIPDPRRDASIACLARFSLEFR